MKNLRISSLFILLLGVVLGLASPATATTVDCEQEECGRAASGTAPERSVPGLTVPILDVAGTAIVSDPEAQVLDADVDESEEFAIPARIGLLQPKKNKGAGAAKDCRGYDDTGYECSGASLVIPGVHSYGQWNLAFGGAEDDGRIRSQADRTPTRRSGSNWQNGRRTRDTRIDRRGEGPLLALARASNGPPMELPLPVEENGRGIPGFLKERPAAAVPEPTAALLFGAGIFVIGLATRRPRD